MNIVDTIDNLRSWGELYGIAFRATIGAVFLDRIEATEVLRTISI